MEDKIMGWRERVWYWDTEVFKHRWLLNALSVDGRRISFSNEPQALADWIKRTDPILMGYNCKHYDNYILKGILSGQIPEMVKNISDAIIIDGINGWEIDVGRVGICKTIDLMLDLPTRPSLKMIEGNLKMSIEESSISFDTEYPTDSEWADVVKYCWHDVTSLVALREARNPYLEAKETIAKMIGFNVVIALNMTNAKLDALYLRAEALHHDDEREYVLPKNLKLEKIPKEVLDFFGNINNYDITLNQLFGRKEDG